MIEKAAAVVVRAGDSLGIRWEIEQVSTLRMLHKYVILLVDALGFPFGRDDCQCFARAFTDCTGIVLQDIWWNSWFIYFDHAGTPRASRLANLGRELLS
jgi:hypothetical protein